MGIRWPKEISNTELWVTTGQKPIILKIGLRKCRCICRTPKKDHDSVGKQLLDWNPQCARRRGRQKQASKKTILKETGKCGKTWARLRGWRAIEADGNASQMPYVSNGRKGYTAAVTTTAATETNRRMERTQ